MAYWAQPKIGFMVCDCCLPFFNRLLLRPPSSLSSLSVPLSFLESRLSVLSCLFNGCAVPRTEGLYSGVFLADVMGEANCFGGVAPLGSAAASGRLTLVKPELTAVKPPELFTGVKALELTAVNPADDI